MKPLISVIVPVYNVEEYVERCIRSILEQSYSNMEIILVDDGSTDNSSKICDLYAKKDNRIVVLHKENGGLSDARNAGIELIKGDYLTFIDSDDWVEKDYLEYLFELIDNNKTDVSICDFNYVDNEGKLFNSPSNDKKIYVWNQKDAIQQILNGNKIVTSSTGKLYKVYFFKELNLRFPVGRLFEDIPVSYDVLLNAKSVSYGNRALYNYYYRPGSISNMSFSPQRLHSVEHLEKALSKVIAKYPEFSRDCKVAMFRMNFGVVLCFDDKKENEKYRKEVIQNVQGTRTSVLFSKNTSLKWKIKAIVSFFGPRCVKKLFS